MADSDEQLKATARLEVQLKTVLDRLSEVSNSMVTRDLFLAQQQNNEFRFRTVEEQLSNWRAESVAEHVRLEADSKARHQVAQADSLARHQETRGELKDVRDRMDNNEETLKQARNGRVQAFVVAGLALGSSVIMLILDYGLGGR